MRWKKNKFKGKSMYNNNYSYFYMVIFESVTDWARTQQNNNSPKFRYCGDSKLRVLPEINFSNKIVT